MGYLNPKNVFYAALLSLGLSSCSPKYENIELSSNSSPNKYADISSTKILDFAEIDKKNVFSYMDSFYKSEDISLMVPDKITYDESYLDMAQENLTHFIQKLSDVSFRYDEDLYEDNQKLNLEQNVVQAHNKLIDMPLDAFLFGATKGSKLHFLSLDSHPDFNVIQGLIQIDDAGRDNNGFYVLISGSYKNFDVFKDKKAYMGNSENNIDAFYGSYIDPKNTQNN